MDFLTVFLTSFKNPAVRWEISYNASLRNLKTIIELKNIRDYSKMVKNPGNPGAGDFCTKASVNGN